MSLQYVTTTNPPPAQSVVQYDVEPSTVFVSTADQKLYANLTINVFNPTSAVVNCMELQFGFLAGASTGGFSHVTVTCIWSSYWPPPSDNS